MRLTTRLSTAGETGFMSMPGLKQPLECYTLENGRMDEVALRTELANHPGIQFSGDDDRATLAFAAELMDRMKTSFERLMRQTEDVHAKKKNDAPRAAERRFGRGKYVGTVVDVSHSAASGFRISVAVRNKMNVVGGAEVFAQKMAQAFADNIVAIEESLDDDDRSRVRLVEGFGCEGIFVRARKRNRAVALRNRYWDCPRRLNGYCSPVDFACPLLKNGKCNWENVLACDGHGF